ncbi:mitogen-activated protein kinase kinase kinase NPK1-like [Notolabrus celidotus]|uniref:mitogen-activated protein kinase kinase kinase NPK1-like n=1 Tax=Notolabrus celidotus TaxID=1203425 RepID=UPI00148FB997|nr:mitogen-activated protein kinase kinase kinase NPK1-like [Notolabrus celidotus]
MAPMEWKPRTKKRSGHYQKLIMEETPPRLILKGHETYDDLVNTGKNSFWPDEIEGSEFTLCHVDGTRWTKEDFYKEFKTVSDIPNPWKRTLYIGRREIEVVCLGDGSCTLDEIPETGVNDCESGDLDEIPETGVAEDVADKDFHPEPSSSEEFRSVRARKKSQSQVVGSSAGGAVGRAAPGEKTAVEGDAVSGHGMNHPESSLTLTPNLPSLYLPRVPYVDSAMIKYNEDNPLGEGTFGKVFGGCFQGTPAAVKKIALGSGGTDRDIQHEINVSLRLSHPNIVRLMAAARTESCYLLATEYVHGASLEAVLQKESCFVKLEGDDASFIALDLSMAVEYIHSQSIIHQDIKPANVMVHHPSKKAVLTDWGLAYIRDTVMLRKGSRFTTEAVGPTGGTYLYMAPECLLNFEEASWQTDMWSLGVTFLELLTGSVPWVVNKQRELAALLVIKTPPHALAHLSERYSYLSGLVDYEASSRPTASDVVQLIKSGLDLSGRYGYSW